jgi:hypothetical protein
MLLRFSALLLCAATLVSASSASPHLSVREREILSKGSRESKNGWIKVSSFQLPLVARSFSKCCSRAQTSPLLFLPRFF